MGLIRLLLWMVLLVGIGTAGVSCAPEHAHAERKAIALDVDRPVLSLAIGTTLEVTATLILSDKTKRNVTEEAAWTSSDSACATVVAGRVSGGIPGKCTITVASSGLTKPVEVTVSSTAPAYIELSPSDSKMGCQDQKQNLCVVKGLSGSFVATGVFGNNTKQDLTAQATWASADPNIASVSGGVVTAFGVGTTAISAMFNGVTASRQVQVTKEDLVSIAIGPTMPTVPLGVTTPLTATGTFTDGSTQVLTNQAVWTSSTPANATVDAATGVVTSVELGTSTISATVKGSTGTVTGTTVVTVTDATLVSLSVTPATSTIAKGLTKQFKAQGVFSDSTAQDMTTLVTWESSDTNTATISNASSSAGLATTRLEGNTKISATFGFVVSDSVSLTVTAAQLVTLSVTPETPSVAKGLTKKFTVTGTYTDTSTQDLTTQAVWSSSDANVAKISNAPGSEGLATALDEGPTTISAKIGTVSGNTTLTVTAAELVSIAVTPAMPSVANGLTQQFTAKGTYTDTTTQDLTTQVTWDSSDTNTATISNDAGSNGLATTLLEGSTTISATVGSVSGNTTLTVTP